MSHVRDLWMMPGPNGRKVRSARYGKGKRWQARWSEHGSERSATFANKDAAETHLAMVTTGAVRTRPRLLTVREFTQVWEGGQLHYARSTREAVHQRLGVMLLPQMGDRYLDEVSRADMQVMVSEWAKRYAASTVRQAFSFTTSLFGTAVRDGLIDRSPCVDVNLPPRKRDRVQPLEVERVRQVQVRMPDWLQSMVVVGAATGMRSGELRGLTVDRVVGQDVRIDRQMVDVENGRPVWGPPKSESGERVVAMGEVARRALTMHLEDFAPGVEGLIWTLPSGLPIDERTAAKQWTRVTAGMGLRPRTGWHDLRHHHASLLISAGFSPKAVAERLGHADAAEVLRTYAHLWPSDHARMVDVVDAALFLLIPSENIPNGANDSDCSVD